MVLCSQKPGLFARQPTDLRLGLGKRIVIASVIRFFAHWKSTRIRI
jgi:hypothetical protein